MTHPTVQGGDASLSALDSEGRSPLHYAALSGDTTHLLYNLLVEKGASTAIKDKVR